jgi:predicted ArsR family transcriptional regulator
MEFVMSNYSNMSAKEKILAYLSKEDGYNTLTVAQARARFKIDNVTARIDELRKEGYAIYTNRKTLADGRKIQYYKLGKPTKKVVAAGVEYLRMQGINAFA